MKKIVATRMYDFSYFHDLFFAHYGNMNFDILVFCKKEDVQTIQEKYNKSKVFFYELPEHQIPYVYEEEKIICNWIYQKTLTFYENNYLNDEALILFVDDDEYYTNINPTSSLSKVVFFEWYLPINHNVITATEFYNLVLSKRCKGKLLSLWNDPFYKETILKVSSPNIQFFKSCVYSNAFHRLLNNQELLIIDKEFVFSNHLKGIPLQLAQKRISKVNNSIKKQDDWCSNHYSFEYQKFHSQYDKFYNKLKSYEELMKYTQKRVEEFEQEESFFETNILSADWKVKTENSPSLFYKK
jgi:hypothetical protein